MHYSQASKTTSTEAWLEDSLEARTRIAGGMTAAVFLLHTMHANRCHKSAARNVLCFDVAPPPDTNERLPTHAAIDAASAVSLCIRV